jgi:NAD(P)-dependent dehydrogenase (short-subunit alcohol dehydrogenase family)
METFANKTALITGGTKGIGRGIAEALARAGMNVVITSRTMNAAVAAATEIAQTAGVDQRQVIGLEADVRSLQMQRKVVQTLLDQFGSLDVLVANAGVGHFAPITELTEDQWRETIDINLTGVFYSLKAAVEALKVSQGYFISIASLAGTNFFAQGSAYNASKFGLVGFTQAVMLDLRQAGINCSTIMPGSVATHFNGNEPDSSDAWKIQPEDMGQMVVDLLRMPARTLPSKIEVRPSRPPSK